MPTKLLWIIKDANSERLSQSTRLEESRIRRHVQTHRRIGVLSNLQSDALLNLDNVPHRVFVHPSGSELRDFYDPLKSKIIWPLTPSNQLLTDTERRGLDFYIHRTAPECSGWQDNQFWNVLVVQATHKCPEITHALISIAAWHRGLAAVSDANHAAEMSQLTSSQWIKALACARMSGNISYSTSLIHCVVLACLQAHKSDYQDFRLLRSAAGMLYELDASENMVPAQERELIDGQVRPLVERLQAKLCMIGDLPAALQRSAQRRQSLGLAPRECPHIPDRFTTMRQARDCLEAIFDWAHDHILVDLRGNLPTPPYNMHVLLKTHIDQWNAAVDASASTSPPETIAFLRLSSLHGLILVQTCTAADEMIFDEHVHTFRAMIHILHSINPNNMQGSTISFGIDSGLLDIVAFVATRCREPCVRHAAIAWLQTASRIEGDRLSVVSAQIASVWLRLEEEGLAQPPACAADIPENRRLRLLCGARHHAKGLVMLDFVGPSTGKRGGERRLKFCIDERSGADYGDPGIDSVQAEEDLGLPDVIIERCGAAFLDDAETGSYHRVEIDRFYFPIPRI